MYLPCVVVGVTKSITDFRAFYGEPSHAHASHCTVQSNDYTNDCDQMLKHLFSTRTNSDYLAFLRHNLKV